MPPSMTSFMSQQMDRTIKRKQVSPRPDTNITPSDWLDRYGYTAMGCATHHVREVWYGDLRLFVLASPLLFHWKLTIHDPEDVIEGYLDRWCYQTEESALAALAAFPEQVPQGYEPTGWHRHPHTGRRRDLADPDREHVNW